MRVFAALVLALFAYVRMDILIWQRIFETDQLWQYAGVYHRGWFVALYGLIGVGVILLNSWRDRVFYAVSLFVLCFNGTNDVLYYWLDLRKLPHALPWLDNHPLILFQPVTDGNLLLNCALWLTVLVVLHFLLRKRNPSAITPAVVHNPASSPKK